MSPFFSMFVALCIASWLPAAMAHGDASPSPAKGVATDEHPFGMQGEPGKAARVVPIVMDDTMRFRPASITVREGETITLAIRNEGKVMHELVLGTPADLARHAELMRKHPGMEHDEPYMAHVKPGATRRLTWRFSKSGTFEFACLVPGHYEAGMKGVVAVTAAAGAGATGTRTAAITAGEAATGTGTPAGTAATVAPSASNLAPSAESPLAEGEVRKVDLAAGKVTLRHGEIRNLEMPPMTMVFGVADPGVLHQLKVGDKVRFTAQRRGGAIVITSLAPAP